MYDVFISYRRNGGIDFSRLMYEKLSNEGLNVFFDIEEINEGKFNNKLYDSIDKSNYFLLILSKHSMDRCINKGDWVRTEIAYALEKQKKIVPLMLSGFEWPVESLEEIEEIKMIQAISFSEIYFDASMKKLFDRIHHTISNTYNQRIKGAYQLNDDHIIERHENKYFQFERDKKELRRLNNQKKILKEFDKDIYERVQKEYKELIVLDVGSNRGDLIIDRLGQSSNLGKILGLEYDGDAVVNANEKYGVINKISFYQVDVESAEFVDKLEEYMAEMNIEKFNVIHISMLILHLKNPYKVLKQIRNYMTEDGVIIIKDIDDGLNFAYPDENNDFKRVISICSKNETSGFRNSGRQIYTLLKRAGYCSVKIEKSGLSTAEMGYDERDALFDTYFSFILEDLKIMAGRYPDNKHIINDLEWYENIYDELEQRFQDANFLFSLGFMIYTARKQII